jgi:hypothetical protein
MLPGMPLAKCTSSTKNFNPTNFGNHVKNKHSLTDCPLISHNKSEKLRVKLQARREATMTKDHNLAIVVSFVMKSSTNVNALDEAQMLRYRFLNNVGVAIRQGALPEFITCFPIVLQMLPF